MMTSPRLFASLRPRRPSSLEQAPRHSVELRHQGWIACFRRRDHGVVEVAIGADRARFVLTRKIVRQARHQALGFLGIGGQHLYYVLHRDSGVDWMPANENRYQFDRRISEHGVPR